MAIYLGGNLVQASGGEPVDSTIINENITTTSSATKQIILPDQGYTGIGKVVINPIQLKKGVIRPDAELVQSWTYDKNIQADEGVTIPAYTTSSTTLKTTGELSTVTLDATNYNYCVLERFLAIPKYESNIASAGREEYFASTYLYETLGSSTFKAISDSTKSVIVNPSFSSSYYYRYIYWSNSSTLTAVSSTTYGARIAVSAPTVSSSTLIINSPYLRITGSATYFASDSWSLLEDIRYQYIIELYRVEKGNLNYDGFGLNQQMYSIIDNVDNNNGKLT